MLLFNSKKKESARNKQSDCCCENACNTLNITAISGNVKSIKVLGSGCQKCHKQFENVKDAIRRLNIDVDVEYITDMEEIMLYGIMTMPAIVINEKIVSAGRVLRANEIEDILVHLK